MDSGTISDPSLRLVALTALTLYGASLLCLLYSLLLRLRRRHREARQRELATVWQGLCFAAMVSDLPARLPTLRRHDARLFAEIWLDCMDRVRGGAAKTGLMHLARRVDLTRFLLSLLRARDR